MKIYINVPFFEKGEAKSLGARWDKELKSWYIPEHISSDAFVRWIKKIPDNLGVEALYVDLVPNTAWFSNVRSVLSSDEWKIVAQEAYKRHNHLCACCNGRGPSHPVECHERFSYDHASKRQSLVKTVALCPNCHQATHFGLARVKGRDGEALLQLQTVNHWTREQATKHVNEAMAEYAARSKIQWVLDLTWLISKFDLSPNTIEKINSMARGENPRDVTAHQRKIISDREHEFANGKQ